MTKFTNKNPTPASLAKLDSAGPALNLTLNSTAEKSLQWTGAHYCLQRDKIGPQLAVKLSAKFNAISMPKICSPSGPITQNPKCITEMFHSFCSKLGRVENPIDAPCLEVFLEDIFLPRLMNGHQSIFDLQWFGHRGLMASQLAIIKPLRPPFLLTWSISSTLSGVVHHLNRPGIYPCDPKSVKDSSDVGNYRPISLNNNDLKMISKILKNRLVSFIGVYIHKDQVRFMPGRQGLDHIRRAIHVICLMKSGWDGGPPPGKLFTINRSPKSI